MISPYVIGRIGETAARELFLTGEHFDAERAREIGLVRAVVSEADLDAAVDGRVGELLQAGPRAIAEAKALIREVSGRQAEDVQKETVERIDRHPGLGGGAGRPARVPGKTQAALVLLSGSFHGRRTRRSRAIAVNTPRLKNTSVSGGG